MTDAERVAKLLIIKGLQRDEIDSYEAAAKARPGGMFDGELAALMARYREVAK
jgi:hypothetical protein